jgi:hypothetical protein
MLRGREIPVDSEAKANMELLHPEARDRQITTKLRLELELENLRIGTWHLSLTVSLSGIRWLRRRLASREMTGLACPLDYLIVSAH